MELVGKISRVNFYNSDNGYGVVLLLVNKKTVGDVPERALSNGNVVVVGTFPHKPVLNEEFSFTGEFVNNPNYGLQFKFEYLSMPKMDSVGVIQYLSSDLFPSIGPVTAAKIVSSLGSDAIDQIIENPQVLDDLVSKKSALIITTILSNNAKAQKATLFFIKNGLTLEMANRIIKILGADAISIVQANPYILMNQIPRFGFIKNDQFALKMGIAKTDERRMLAAVGYLVKERIYATGNSYLTFDELYTSSMHFLNDNRIDKDQFHKIVLKLVQQNILYESPNHLIFDYHLYQKELGLASIIARKLINQKLTYTEEQIEAAFKKTESKIHITLSDLQRVAVKAAFTEPITIITGGPGTGKTTIVKAILDMYVGMHKNDQNVLLGVALLAPTGKASKRLSELTNCPAMTIHRFLGYHGDDAFEYGPDNPVNAKLVIIDEASMMDLPLAYQLFSALPTDTQVIIVGDVDQLPSVGPGQILKDLIDTKEIKTIRLNKIHRQAADSKIIQLAHATNEGLTPEDFDAKYPDRIYLPCASINIVGVIKDWIDGAIKKGKTIQKDIQVLAPMYRCVSGINELNNEIQNLVNPKNDEGDLKYMGQVFRVGDKVIQLVNRSDKGIMNGDLGLIDRYIYQSSRISGLVVNYDNKMVEYTLEELDELKLAYAISVHKAQGSEFDIVILPMSSYYHFMFKRKLIYTAITRAKKLLVLIGDANSFIRGIGLIEAKRLTILKDLLINQVNHPNEIQDTTSAFSTLGEYETDFNDISPYEFLDEPKDKQNDDDYLEFSLGEEEFEL